MFIFTGGPFGYNLKFDWCLSDTAGTGTGTGRQAPQLKKGQETEIRPIALQSPLQNLFLSDMVSRHLEAIGRRVSDEIIPFFLRVTDQVKTPRYAQHDYTTRFQSLTSMVNGFIYVFQADGRRTGGSGNTRPVKTSRPWVWNRIGLCDFHHARWEF